MTFSHIFLFFVVGQAVVASVNVALDGVAVRSCVVPVSALAGKTVTTIEGLQSADGTLHALQKACIEHQVPQCGYCQSGQIMAAASLLARTPHPSDDEIAEAMTNICRCGTYPRIRAAIRAVTSQG